MTRQEFQATVQSLVGLRLAGVRYVELAYERDDGTPLDRWCAHPEYDQVDHGIGLRFSDDETVWISWDQEFYQYALSVGSTQNWIDGYIRDSDISDNSRWMRLLGRLITRVQVWWDWQSVGSQEPIWGPQDLEIEFEGGYRVFISALELAPNHQPWGQMNNLTVFFDDDVAKKYPVGPFAANPVSFPPVQ